MSSATLCSFCAEQSNDYENSHYLRNVSSITGINNRVLYETSDFIVFPTIGPITSGHLLLVTKVHFNSLYSTPIHLCDKASDLIRLFQKVFEIRYNTSLLAFEHGTTKPCHHGGASVDHTHIHLLPLNMDLSSAVINDGFTIDKLGRLAELTFMNNLGDSYVLYYDNFDTPFVVYGKEIPSQYMRYLVANQLMDVVEWNWRKDPRLDLFTSNYYDLINFDFDSIRAKMEKNDENTCT